MEKGCQERPNDALVKVVCPRAEDLSVILNNVRCEECGLTFSNESRLRMHVLKIHEHKDLKKKTVNEQVRYHCPEIMCVYALKSSRYFTTMKYLKQHYLKVHAAKKFPCAQCDKSFSTEAARSAHLRACGVQFTCSCLRVFGTYEALLTHGKRASHAVDAKYKRTLVGKPRAKSPQRLKIVHVWSLRGNAPILPRRGDSSASTAKIAFDVAVQTDEIKRQRRTASPSKTSRRRESRQTQTSLSSKEKRARKTVETQTTRVGRITKNAKSSTKIAPKNHNGEPASTLSSSLSASTSLSSSSSSFVKALALHENFPSENLFPSSPLELQHDVALQDFWEEKNTSLGTQTSEDKDFLQALSDSVTQTNLASFYRGDCLQIGKTNVSCLTELAYDRDSTTVSSFDRRNDLSRSDPMLTIDNFGPDRFSSIETQTDTERDRFFASEVAANVARNFALSSNNETQTTENFDNIEQLLYSNTCTQTCNEILPSDLVLSDIQTQTAWPHLEDATISAETQTTLNETRDLAIPSSCSRSWLNTRISHTETQTDLFAILDEFS